MPTVQLRRLGRDDVVRVGADLNDVLVRRACRGQQEASRLLLGHVGNALVFGPLVEPCVAPTVTELLLEVILGGNRAWGAQFCLSKSLTLAGEGDVHDVPQGAAVSYVLLGNGEQGRRSTGTHRTAVSPGAT